MPWWRFNVFISLMAAGLGDEHLAIHAQDEAARTLPESLLRFHTHLEMHRGLMLVRGDREGGTAHALWRHEQAVHDVQDRGLALLARA